MEATQFKDSKGEIWTLDINVGHYLKIKSKFGIDISESFSQENNWLAKLAAHENIEILLGVLDLLTSEEREERGLTLDQMYEGMNGDVIADSTQALVEATVLFLPAHKQKAMRIVVDSVKVGMERTVKHIEEKAVEVLEKVEEEVDKAIQNEYKT